MKQWELKMPTAELGQGAFGAHGAQSPGSWWPWHWGSSPRQPWQDSPRPQGGPLIPSLPRSYSQAKWILSLELLRKFHFITFKCCHTPEDSLGRSADVTCHRVISVLRFWGGEPGAP